MRDSSAFLSFKARPPPSHDNRRHSRRDDSADTPFGLVVGTIDVESESVDAFSGRDESLLVTCAEALQ